jgi:hypothetical protein
MRTSPDAGPGLLVGDHASAMADHGRYGAADLVARATLGVHPAPGPDRYPARCNGRHLRSHPCRPGRTRLHIDGPRSRGVDSCARLPSHSATCSIRTFSLTARSSASPGTSPFQFADTTGRSAAHGVAAQINPHFLFNTLNAVSTLSLRRGDRRRRPPCHRAFAAVATHCREGG